MSQSVADLIAQQANGQPVQEPLPDDPDDLFTDEPAPPAPPAAPIDSYGYTADGRPVCTEPGCPRGCRKIRHSDNFHPYCSAHLTEHNAAGDYAGPTNTGTSGQKTPGSRTPHRLAEERKAAARRVEQNVTGWLAMVQGGFIASGDMYCARGVGEIGPPLAAAVGNVAVDFPILQKGLDKADKWASLGVLAYQIARLGLLIGVHHGVVKYEGPIRFLVPQPPQAQEQQPPPGYGPQYGPPPPVFAESVPA